MKKVSHAGSARWIPIWLGTLCLLSLSCTQSDSQGSTSRPRPRAAVQGLDQKGQLQIHESDRCPVCAMRVKKNPKFACAMQLQDKKTYYFCTPGCMIRTFLHPEVFLGVERSDIQRMVVQAYFSGKPQDAMSAVWVTGSDLVGPMGPALVPLEHEKAAKVFIQRHGGKTTFKLGEIDDAKWKALTGKKSADK